ncbi:MAG: type I-MYXAN CRISPR-associated Cas8a1/Cmx1 [Planctomycetia bacterium]|nr:type I-MYXAN CRISPR-associated Cas8a1/Cmx1 [Planctomycetia bacterium]
MKPIAPNHLTMPLFAPGMTALHRAGLGGLACTLKHIERAYLQGALADDDVPGGPWDDGAAPWEIEAEQLTLRFCQPDAAGEYLRRLFALSFGVHGGLIWLPGQYELPPNLAVRADLQLGLTLTFLQHGKTRTLAKELIMAAHEPERDGVPGVVVEYRTCFGYKHQNGWMDCVDKKTGCLSATTVGIEGPLNPGAVVRHNAFSSPTKIDERVERLVPLYFALIGCITIPVNRGVGVLLIPEVEDLATFSAARPLMTPTSSRQCLAAGAADAGLQLQIRLKAAHLGLTAFHAVTFRPTPWASQQKSRVESLYVPVLRSRDLDLYELALAHLPPRVATQTLQETTGRGKAKVTLERRKSFRTDSVVRPRIADNLANGRRWYTGFTRLMTATNPATNKPYRNQLTFEREGLHDMVTDARVWNDEGEALVVQAVHEAIRQRFGQIADNYKSNPAGMRNKFNNERERLRLAFTGAKTVAQARTALCDLFSRGGSNKPLQQAWRKILPMFHADRWQHTRDLALLALASYGGRSDDDVSNPESAPI